MKRSIASQNKSSPRAGLAAGIPSGQSPVVLGSSAAVNPFAWQSILVPTDFTDSSQTAIRCAVWMAQLSGAKIIVLHVVKISRASRFDSRGSRISDGEQTQLVHQKLAAWIRQFVPDAVKAEPLVRWGLSIDDVINSTASRWKTDLIVMCGHARPFWQRLFDVKTASRVVRYAPCDVHYVCFHEKVSRPARRRRPTEQPEPPTQKEPSHVAAQHA